MALHFIPCNGCVSIAYDTINEREVYKIAPWGVFGEKFTVYYRGHQDLGWVQERRSGDRVIFNTMEEAKTFVQETFAAESETE